MVHDARSRSSVVCAYSASQHDLVELDAERVGDQLHRFGEHRGALRHLRLQFGVVDRLAEARGPLGVG